MNSETSVIVAKLTEISTKQDERHTENINKFETLFDKIDTVVNQCNTNKTDIKWIKWLVCSVLIGGVVFGIWMNNLPKKDSPTTVVNVKAKK